MANKPKKYLVVGGAGFIGSNLVNELIRLKHKVVVLDNLVTGKRENVNPKAKFIKADICHLSKIQPHFRNIDGVFHLAALPRVPYSIKYPARTNRINVNGTLNVLIASQRADAGKVVFSSSSSVYGEPDKLPFKEGVTPINALSPYALHKYIGEEYCRLFSVIYGLKTACLRYFNVYGRGMAFEGAYALAMSVFIRQLRKKQVLTVTGDGTQTRDFTHISDVVRANILAMNSKKMEHGEAVNIGGSKNYTMNYIAKMFGDDITHIASRIEPHDTLADVSLAKKLLGWAPKTKLEDGVKDLKKIYL